MATQTVTAQAPKSPIFPRRWKITDSITPYLLVFPTLLLILVITVYPMLDSLLISIQDNPLLPTPGIVGLANYVRVIRDPIFLSAIGSTGLFTAVSVALETLLGLGVALLINKSFPGRGLVRAAILVPWAFPTVVSAQMWLLMYNDQTGIITYLLQLIHLLGPGETLLGSTSGVITASIITDVWKTTPFMALLILAGLQVIPNELYEAASVDGSTRWQKFWSITLPMLKNPLLIALLFRTLDAVRVFDLFFIFGQKAVPSMASYADFNIFTGTPDDFAPGVASAVIVFLIALAISIAFISMMRDVVRQAA